MQPGEVISQRFVGAESIASYVAFAASVHTPGSTTSEMVFRIGAQLGTLANDNSSIQVITAPLLGAGAGGLRSEDGLDALQRGFSSNCNRPATLRIFVLHDSVFSRLQAWLQDRGAKPVSINLWGFDRDVEPRRVFISYTKSTSQHEEWVEGLARFLRDTGTNVRLDKWDLRAGMDLPQWMSNELDLADKVVLICDEAYAQRADRRHGGVGWEVRLVLGDLMQCQQTTKYIPVVCCQKPSDALPSFLETTMFVHWLNGKREAENKAELLRAIYDLDNGPTHQPTRVSFAPLFRELKM
jgi:hypothetical protein